MAHSRTTAVNETLARLQRGTLIVTAVFAVASLVGLFVNQTEFFRSYLLGFVIWLGVAVGCVALLMLHYLTSGAWGFALRRFLEAGARPLPLLGLLFVPLVFGLPLLYAWARPEVVAADPLLQHKAAYLNAPFFVIRAAVYLLLWSGFSWLLIRWSRRQDEQDDQEVLAKARRLSGPGLALLLFTTSLAAIDWMMSLEPHWFSTVYGLIVFSGQLLAGLALALTVSLWLRKRPPLNTLVTPGIFYDLGNLLMGFLLLWIYLAFVQYLVIWAGNLPEEVPWVLRRMQGGWQVVWWVVLFLGFVAPFGALVSSGFRPRTRMLTFIAPLVFVMQVVMTYWLVMPAFYPAGLHFHWLHLTAPLALGGVWLAAGLHYLRRMPLLPQHDPRLKEIFEEHERQTAS